VCMRSAEAAWRIVYQSEDGTEFCPPDDSHLIIAQRLRSSLLRVLELEDAHCARLLSAPYDIPAGLGMASAQASWQPRRSPRPNPLQPGDHGFEPQSL